MAYSENQTTARRFQKTLNIQENQRVSRESISKINPCPGHRKTVTVNTLGHAATEQSQQRSGMKKKTIFKIINLE